MAVLFRTMIVGRTGVVAGFNAMIGMVMPGLTRSVGRGRKIDQNELTIVGRIVGGHRCRLCVIKVVIVGGRLN